MKFKINESKTKLLLVDSSREEYSQLKLSLNPFVNNYRFMQRYKLGVWDGKLDFFNNGQINFGLWKEIQSVCKEYEFKFQLENKEDFPVDNTITLESVQKFADEFFEGYKSKKTLKDPEGKDYKPYDYQIEAVYRLLKYKYGGIEVATSGGKSLIFGTLLFYYLRNINPNGKILLIVPSILLVTQFYDDILDYNEGYNKEQKNPVELNIMEIMSEKPRKVRDGKIPNLFIGTYQSLEKYPKEFFAQFDMVCVDEAHIAKAVTIKTILERTFGIASYRFGMSGTYPKTPAENLSIQSLTGPNLYTVKAKELIARGLISNMKIKALILQYNDEEFAQNVFMIKKRGGGKTAYDLEKKYAQASEKRKLFLNKLIDKFKQNTLVLFHTIEYGTMLYDFFRNNIQGKDFYYIDGQTPKEKRAYIKKQMETTDGNPKVLVATFGTLSTGVNIKAICNIVFADSFKSDNLIRQSIGRGLRLHDEKNKLIVFDVVDQFHYAYRTTLYNHFLERLNKIYKLQEFPCEELKILI